jgi:hypothetical protein
VAEPLLRCVAKLILREADETKMSAAIQRSLNEHPDIVFRPGPTGRRAGLVGGPDVWEVVRAVKSARAADPGLAEDDLLALVAENTGIPVRLIRAAVRYWASYTEEIDAEIAAAEAAEEAAEDAWRRERRLLAG